jgi:hypothetical protein
VNEDGLPIIDITEPIAATAERGENNPLLVEEDRLIPISSHPPSARERWRKERDRILDLLEEEERRDQVREEQANEEHRQEILRKRREAAAHEKAKLKAAKGMQKKLGKALLRSLAETGTKGEDDRKTMPAMNESNKTKKTVTFAGLPDDSEESNGDSTTSLQRKPIEKEWGDVIPARLRSTPGPSLMPSRQPMQLTVVERCPASQQTPLPTTAAKEPDSDDESDPGLLNDSEQQADSPRSPVNSDDNLPPDSDVDENLVLEEDLDLDLAQHQREIALQYHEKRSKIGQVAAAAMMNHSHSDDDIGRAVCEVACTYNSRWMTVYFQDTPLDVPSSEQSRPPISRFRANRVAASYNASTPSSTSTSLGASVLPASSARTLQRAFRTGKLDADEQLVGGEADSESENENEGMQEVLELLRKGEVYNLGPDGSHIHVIPSNTSSNEGQLSTSAASFVTPPSPQSNLPPLKRPKTSKFKLSQSRPKRQTPDVAILNHSSQDQIPMSPDERSSQKLPAAMATTVVERLLCTTSASSTTAIPTVHGSSSALPSTHIPTPRAPPSIGTQAFSMVVDSPSFPRPTEATVTSFHVTSRPSQPPTIVASALGDASRQGSTATNAAARKTPTVMASPSSPQSARPSKPPAVVSSVVNESSNHQDTATQDISPRQGKKISRFMAQRM